MTSLATAVCDSGPLVAATIRQDPNHARCAAILLRQDVRIVVPTMAVAEAAYLIAREGGPRAEVAFLRSLVHLEVEAPLVNEWLRIADLCEQYADFPLGGTDASVIALAERLKTDTIITLDRRHFAAVRPLHVANFQLLPDA